MQDIDGFTRIYKEGEQVCHLRSNQSAADPLCVDPETYFVGDDGELDVEAWYADHLEWCGTGSQDEIDRAAALPPCPNCLACISPDSGAGKRKGDRKELYRRLTDRMGWIQPPREDPEMASENTPTMPVGMDRHPEPMPVDNLTVAQRDTTLKVVGSQEFDYANNNPFDFHPPGPFNFLWTDAAGRLRFTRIGTTGRILKELTA